MENTCTKHFRSHMLKEGPWKMHVFSADSIEVDQGTTSQFYGQLFHQMVAWPCKQTGKQANSREPAEKRKLTYLTHVDPCWSMFDRGRSVTTTSSDGTLKIWNAEAPESYRRSSLRHEFLLLSGSNQFNRNQVKLQVQVHRSDEANIDNVCIYIICMIYYIHCIDSAL